MPKITNRTEYELTCAGETFAPHERREVAEPAAASLLTNPNFAQADIAPPRQVTPPQPAPAPHA